MTWTQMRTLIRWARNYEALFLRYRHPTYMLLAQNIRALSKTLLWSAKKGMVIAYDESTR